MLPAAGSAAANSAVLSVLAGSVRALASSAQASIIRRLLLQTPQPQPAAVALLQRAAQQSTRNPLAVAQVRTLATYQQQRHRLWLSSCSGGAGISTGGSSATNGSSWWQFPAVSMAVLPALGLQLTASSISRGYVTTGPAADDASSAEEEAPRRRRRSATESKAALRRTTVSTPLPGPCYPALLFIALPAARPVDMPTKSVLAVLVKSSTTLDIKRLW